MSCSISLKDNHVAMDQRIPAQDTQLKTHFMPLKVYLATTKANKATNSPSEMVKDRIKHTCFKPQTMKSAKQV